MPGKICYSVCFFTYLSVNLTKRLCAPQVVLTLGAAGLMDKAGRRILLMISAGGMGLSNFLVAFSFYARSVQPEQMSPAFSTFISILALVSLLAYIASFSLGMGAIPWIIMSEV
jgi:SP family sugar porter-like MFS transporter